MGEHLLILLAVEEGRFVLRPVDRGFTLIELSIVLAIMAGMLAWAIPAFSVWVANARVRSVAESLQNDMRQAQAEAVRRNRQVALVLTNNTPSVDSPSATVSTSALNWVLYALPLLGSDETANEITATTQEGGTTGFLQGFNQGTNSNTTINATPGTLCFSSIGRLATSSSAIANAANATCSIPTTSTPRYFRVQNSVGDRPLWVSVSLGGQIRLCDPNRVLPDQLGGCCTEVCCGLSSDSHCVY